MKPWKKALLIACFAVSSAHAGGPLFTFGFNDLDGTYTFDGVTGDLTAVPSAVSAGGPFDSSGDVTRAIEPQGTAVYDVGFPTLPTMASFLLEMQLTNVTANSADGLGSFLVVDDNGDEITGDLSGSWSLIGGFSIFEGLAQNVLIGSLSGDGTFDGPSGGAFDLDIPFGPVYEGATLALVTGAWFDAGFENQDVQVTASFVPEPGTLAVLLIGAPMLLCRRRSTIR